MYSIALGVRRAVTRAPVIRRVENAVKNSCLVLWRKELPGLPLHVRVDDVGDHLDMSIPRAGGPRDLYGTHLEVRIMDPRERHCFCRFCLWCSATHIHIATPNDTRRDIDNLGYDLFTTRRTVPLIDKPFSMRVRKVDQYYFVRLGPHLVPVDYSCYGGGTLGFSIHRPGSS